MRAKCSEIRHPNNEEALYRRSGKSIGRSLSSHHNNNKTVAGCDIDNELLRHYFEFAKSVLNPLASFIAQTRGFSFAYDANVRHNRTSHPCWRQYALSER